MIGHGCGDGNGFKGRESFRLQQITSGVKCAFCSAFPCENLRVFIDVGGGEQGGFGGRVGRTFWILVVQLLTSYANYLHFYNIISFQRYPLEERKKKQRSKSWCIQIDQLALPFYSRTSQRLIQIRVRVTGSTRKSPNQLRLIIFIKMKSLYLTTMHVHQGAHQTKFIRHSWELKSRAVFRMGYLGFCQIHVFIVTISCIKCWREKKP